MWPLESEAFAEHGFNYGAPPAPRYLFAAAWCTSKNVHSLPAGKFTSSHSIKKLSKSEGPEAVACLEAMKLQPVLPHRHSKSQPRHSPTSRDWTWPWRNYSALALMQSGSPRARGPGLRPGGSSCVSWALVKLSRTDGKKEFLHLKNV